MSTYLKYKPAWMQLLIFGSLTVGIFVTVTSIGVILIAKIYGITPFNININDLSDPVMLSAAKWLQALYAIDLFLIPSLVFAYLSDKSPMRYIGFQKPVPYYFYVVAVLVIFACFPMVAWLSDLNQHLHLPKSMQATEKLIRDADAKSNDFLRRFLVMKSTQDLIAMILVLAVLPAIAEEVFFRGVLQRLFIQITRRPWIGIVITAIIFSALHGQFLGFIPRLVLGIVLGALFWYSGSIYPGMIAHFLNNAVQVILVYYSPQFLDREPNFAAALIAASTLIVVVLTWWMKKISQTSYAEVYDTDDDFHIGPRDQYIA